MIFTQIGRSDDFECGDYKLFADDFNGHFLPLFKSKKLTDDTDEPYNLENAKIVCNVHRAKLMREKFEEVAKPLIKFINDNYDPHTHAIIDTTHAELSSGICAFQTMEFTKD